MDIWTTNNQTFTGADRSPELAAISNHNGNLIFGLSHNSPDQQAI